MTLLKHCRVLLILTLSIVACSSQPSTPSAKITPIQQVESVLPTVTVTRIPAPTATSTASQIPTEAPTPTLPSPPKDTLWWILPSYASSSVSADYGKLWQVEFNPKIWQLITNKFHVVQLIHRSLDNCSMSPTVGRGLPPEYSLEVERKDINSNSFDIRRMSLKGKLESINYCVSIADANSCFGLHTGDKPAICIENAERVLATLTSVSRPGP